VGRGPLVEMLLFVLHNGEFDFKYYYNGELVDNLIVISSRYIQKKSFSFQNQ
jgi:hypothetical protein